MDSLTPQDMRDFYLAGLRRGRREGIEGVWCCGGVDFDMDEILDLVNAESEAV